MIFRALWLSSATSFNQLAGGALWPRNERVSQRWVRSTAGISWCLYTLDEDFRYKPSAAQSGLVEGVNDLDVTNSSKYNLYSSCKPPVIFPFCPVSLSLAPKLRPWDRHFSAFVMIMVKISDLSAARLLGDLRVPYSSSFA